MKIRNLLTVVAMFSVLLFSVGTAQAVLGVADDVPGTDNVIPFFCEDDGLDAVVADGSMNTLWAIAETTGVPALASVFVFNVKSEFVIDDRASWTPFDILANDCKTLIAGLSPVDRAKLQAPVATNGTAKTIFAGYIIYFNDVVNDQLIPWEYLVDMPNGFAAGFNGFAVEGGVDIPVGFPQLTPSDLTEAGVPVSASALFPRFFFLNNNSGTYNWWIILKGGPITTTAATMHRLNGSICDEDENCISVLINVPNNLNILDVRPLLPASIFTGSGGGFGRFATQSGAALGFLNPTTGAIVTTLGWSYQRASTGAVISNWDVIHPMHRLY